MNESMGNMRDKWIRIKGDVSRIKGDVWDKRG
jgi:hypothetical protein